MDPLENGSGIWGVLGVFCSAHGTQFRGSVYKGRNARNCYDWDRGLCRVLKHS